MAYTVPSTTPSTLYAGTTWTWDRSYSDYPPATWTATAVIVGTDGKLSLTASTNNGNHRFSATATQTAALPAGTYRVYITVTSGAEVYPVEETTLEVKPNPATVAVGEFRTHAERMLAAIEAKLEGRADADLESYTIGNRSVSQIPVRELLRLRNIYRAQVYRQQAGADAVSTKVTFGAA